jgi:hypothetical protein
MKRPEIGCWRAIAFLAFLPFCACRHGGGGDDEERFLNVAGSWEWTVIISDDSCAMATRAGAPSDGVVEIDQSGADFLAALSPGNPAGRPMSGWGSLSGSLFLLNLTGTKTETVCDFYSCVDCILSIRESDSGTVDGDTVQGDMVVTVSGSDLVACGFVGACEIRGTFTGTRCSSPGCP